MNKYHIKCPECGQRWTITLTNDQERRFFEYRNDKELMIQQVFPDLNAVEREFLKTGLCPECQEEIFGNSKTDKIKKIKE